MRFLVTGGAGFIGSAVVRHLIGQTPHEVVVVDKLTYAGNLDSLAAVANHDRYRFVRADIGDGPRMREAIETAAPDVILHLAAETHVDRSIDGAGAFIQTNVVGTSVLLDAALAYWRRLPAARRAGFRFHHVSTDEVFGSAEAGAAFIEETPYRPNSPYAASKAASDHLVRAWHRTYGLPVVLSNCSNNYGPCQFPEKLVPLMILNCLESKKLPVYGRGENVRDWLFVDDHVRALLLVAESGRVGESYNIGGRCERANIDVVKTICALMERLSPDVAIGRRETLISFVADRPGHDLRYAIDASKIWRELGWEPVETFETGLEKTVRWYLANRDWWGRIRAASYRGERLGAGAVILVFGGGGQLGQELVARAKRTGVPLTALSHAEVDIADRAAVGHAIAAVHPSLIVNAAAYNVVDKAESEREAAMRANAEGPEVLARAAAGAGLPLVHISTDYVFDGAKNRPYVEDDTVGPLSVYGLSKARGEEAVRGTLPEHFILRTAWVFGARGSNTLKTVLRLAAERDELAFVADQTGSPTASADLAEAILVLARTPREKRPPGTYHVAGANSATRHALASAIVAAQAAYTGKSPPVRAIAAADYPTPARRPSYSVLDSSKFAAAFGFRPGDWQAGVRAAVAEIFAMERAR